MTLWMAGLYLVLLLTKAVLAGWVARRAPRPAPRGRFEGVGVTQAILSGDPGLAAVLEDNLRTLPGVRWFWLVDEDDPEAQRVCADLAARHPAARITVLAFPPPPAGHNPKLWKLEGARTAGLEPVLVVLDDDTRLPAESLAAMLEGLARGELVTGLPAYLDDGRLPSRLLAQFVNNNAALTYLPLTVFTRPPTINGMGYAVRRGTLAGWGGFRPLLRHLTDDLAVARRALAAGQHIVQLTAPLWVATTVRNFGHYHQLMHRWFLFALLLLRRQTMRWRLAIGGLHGLPPLLLWAVLASAVAAPTVVSCLVVAALVGLRALTLGVLQRTLYGRVLYRPGFSELAELLQPLHLLHAALWRRITWRTRRYRVFDDDRFTPC